MSEDLIRAKKLMRKEFISVRNNLSRTAAQSATKAAAANFLAYVRLPEKQTIAFYHPIKGEMDTLPIMHKVSQMGHITALPVVIRRNEPMEFRQWKVDDPLSESEFFKTLLEPTVEANKVYPSIVVTPVIAFSKQGYRLGYGGGMYDRTISDLRIRVPDVKVIGLAFDNQQAADLPITHNDQRLDYVVTEKKVLAF